MIPPRSGHASLSCSPTQSSGSKRPPEPRCRQLIIHIDRGADWGATQWFFDHLQQQQVQFDAIGQSYYPWWHGSLEALRTCLNNTAQRYAKPVILAETAFPWANSTNLYGIPASTNGQVEYTVALAQVVRRLPGARGAGIFWWGAEYQTLPGFGLAGFDKKSFFDSDGNVLPVADAMGQLVAPLKMEIRMRGTNLFLQWPLSGADAALASSIELSPTASWLAMTNTVQNTGALYSVTAPLGLEQSRFFRLQNQLSARRPWQRYSMPRSSTSNTNVLFGGILGLGLSGP